MDCILGLATKEFCLIAADSGAGRSIVVYKHDEDKVVELDKHKILGAAGPHGDRVGFTSYIQANLQLYRMRNRVQLNTRAAANFTRSTLAESLRTRDAYQVNALLGGYDPGTKRASMYYLDYLGAMHKLKKGVHGHASFCLSIMDKYYHKDMTLEQAIDVLRRCVREVQKRLLIQQPNFRVKITDKDGVRELDVDLSAEPGSGMGDSDAGNDDDGSASAAAAAAEEE